MLCPLKIQAEEIGAAERHRYRAACTVCPAGVGGGVLQVGYPEKVFDSTEQADVLAERLAQCEVGHVKAFGFGQMDVYLVGGFVNRAFAGEFVKQVDAGTRFLESV